MIASDLISPAVPPLKPEDSVEKAMNWMKEFHLEHLPVVEEGRYRGLISEMDLLDLEDVNVLIKDLNIPLNRPFAVQQEHIFDVLQKIDEHRLSLLPVLGEEESYLGVISRESIINFYANISAVKNPGGIVTLEMSANDYSLAEIARIVESNNAAILNATVNTIANSSRIEVILKINQADINAVIATFERFEYTVKQAYQEDEHNDILKDRFDSLMNYLDI